MRSTKNLVKHYKEGRRRMKSNKKRKRNLSDR